MADARFSLSSEQCELIEAFERADSLQQLARQLGREMSVVSRQIKRVAETAPVLEKRKGRWHITPLGRQIAAWSRDAIANQRRLLEQHALRMSTRRLAHMSPRAVLLLVGCQRGFDDPAWGVRNNPGAEQSIMRLLATWRGDARRVIHVQHVSRERTSPLHPSTSGHEFLAFARPHAGETVVQKTGSSAFHGTALADELRRGDHDTLVVAGFTLNHCVDATVRAAADLGFTVYLAADATVSFGRVGPSGHTIAPDVLHASALACLSQEFAVVVDTDELVLDAAPGVGEPAP